MSDQSLCTIPPVEKRVHHRSLKMFMQYLFVRNLANNDSMVLVTGEKGSGKTTLGMWMTILWLRMLNRQLSLKKHCVYTNEQFDRAIRENHDFSPILGDEAVNFALASEWAKVENRETRKLLGKIRPKHLLFVLCSPVKITKIESTYLDSYVNYWIHVFSRGQAALFVRDKNMALDTWRIKDFESSGNISEFTHPERLKQLMEQHPNFWQFLSYPALPKRLEILYRKHRELNIYDSGGGHVLSRTDMQKVALLLFLREKFVLYDGMKTTALCKSVEEMYGVKITPQQFVKIYENLEEEYGQYKNQLAL